jgi:hypothetical protein
VKELIYGEKQSMEERLQISISDLVMAYKAFSRHRFMRPELRDKLLAKMCFYCDGLSND